MIIDNEDIIVYLVGDLHVCVNCCGSRDGQDYRPLTADFVKDGETLVCDQCEEIILEK